MRQLANSNVRDIIKTKTIACSFKLLLVSLILFSSNAFANRVFCSSLMFIENGSRSRVSLITPPFYSDDPATGFYAENGVLRDKWRSFLKSSMKGMHANEAGCMNASEYNNWVTQLRNTGDPIQVVNWPSKQLNHSDNQESSQEGAIASNAQPHTKKNKEERHWVEGVHEKCVSAYPENGYRIFTNKCSFPVIVSYCIKQPIEGHEYLKCQAEKSGASPVGLNYTRASFQVPPGASVSSGGVPSYEPERYIYLACRTDQIPVMYHPEDDAKSYTAECLVIQN
ncbi:TPA: hypothetical protein I8Y25_002453 [Raoultella ornithinolytica]|nr:hypothetical protein [Raoultella ornithinolytica]